jgi:L-ascorbate metabolism protein UlaG (beta-lactamase superfamily)
MSNQHVTPEQAIQAYIDAGGKHFIPMHYGAFFLADDTPKEALDRLNAEWKRLKLDTAVLNILIHGETLPVT